MIRRWEHSQEGVTDRRTDGGTDWTIHKAAWSQLKKILLDHQCWVYSRPHQDAFLPIYDGIQRLPANHNLAPVCTIDILVVSSQTLASSIRQFNYLHYIKKSSTALPVKLFLLCCWKGLTLHEGSANVPISPNCVLILNMTMTSS